MKISSFGNTKKKRNKNGSVSRIKVSIYDLDLHL